MNIVVDKPNFSIVVPGGCNANCSFCFWEPKQVPANYLTRLANTLETLPSVFTSISLTGGEPTLSQYLTPILKLIADYRDRFTTVVLTTNGTGLEQIIRQFVLLGVVDYVNISRHAVNEQRNEEIMDTNPGCPVPSNDEIRRMIADLADVNITTSLNKVYSGHVSHKMYMTSFQATTYAGFAQGIGACRAVFRQVHGSITNDTVEKLWATSRPDITYVGTASCPVCVTSTYEMDDYEVLWKSSVLEPSAELGGIYELVFQPDGVLTADWGGKQVIPDIKTAKPQSTAFVGYKPCVMRSRGSC